MTEAQKTPLFRPLFRYILARKIDTEDKKTAGGIILASAIENKNKLSHTNKAVVVALGSKACEYEAIESRPKVGDIIHFTRYEDFMIDHSTEVLEGEHCMIYDEYITAVELPINKGE